MLGRPTHVLQLVVYSQTYTFCPNDLHYHLVFFSTFEELKLPISGPMESAGPGVTKLYEPFPPSGIVNRRTGTGYLVRTGTYRYVPVRTGTEYQ